MTAAPFFPAGTIHLVVVDPGVGSPRRAIAIRCDQATFLGPDNGVLSWAVKDKGSLEVRRFEIRHASLVSAQHFMGAIRSLRQPLGWRKDYHLRRLDLNSTTFTDLTGRVRLRSPEVSGADKLFTLMFTVTRPPPALSGEQVAESQSVDPAPEKLYLSPLFRRVEGQPAGRGGVIRLARSPSMEAMRQKTFDLRPGTQVLVA